MHPIVKDYFCQVRQFAPIAQAQQQIQILGKGSCVIIATHLAEGSMANHGTGMLNHGSTRQQVILNIRILSRNHNVSDKFILPVDHVVIATDTDNFRLVLQQRYLVCQAFWHGNIIRIHHSDELALGMG